jgi:hypothetical protein
MNFGDEIAQYMDSPRSDFHDTSLPVIRHHIEDAPQMLAHERPPQISKRNLIAKLKSDRKNSMNPTNTDAELENPSLTYSTFQSKVRVLLEFA